MGICQGKKQGNKGFGLCSSGSSMCKGKQSLRKFPYSQNKSQSKDSDFESENNNNGDQSFFNISNENGKKDPLSALKKINKANTIEESPRQKSKRKSIESSRNSQSWAYVNQLQNRCSSSLAFQILCKYEYYSEIDPNSESIHLQLLLIERSKREHHLALIGILSYLNLHDIIRAGRINRKMYIVSGDINLLKNYMKDYPEEAIYNANPFMAKNFIMNNPNQVSEGCLIYQVDHNEQDYDPRTNLHHQEYDIILDQNCSRVKLVNTMFDVSKKNKYKHKGANFNHPTILHEPAIFVNSSVSGSSCLDQDNQVGGYAGTFQLQKKMLGKDLSLYSASSQDKDVISVRTPSFLEKLRQSNAMASVKTGGAGKFNNNKILQSKESDYFEPINMDHLKRQVNNELTLLEKKKLKLMLGHNSYVSGTKLPYKLLAYSNKHQDLNPNEEHSYFDFKVDSRHRDIDKGTRSLEGTTKHQYLRIYKKEVSMEQIDS